MWKNGILRNLTLAALASACLAGIQIPLIIINLSPWEATVDFYNNEYCMQYHTDPDDLNHYYASWESSNLGEDFDEDYAKYNAYLQLYKELFGVPKLNGSQTPMTDIHTIPALKPVDSEGRNTTTSPVRVFEAEIDGGLFNGCAFEQSEK
jgi:hypothetical protein